MKRWIGRLRGALSIGSIWGALGTVVGLAGGAIASVWGGVPLAEALIAGAFGAGGLGFVLGTGFATALTLAEGSRTLHDLTPRRAALWGGLAGAALPVVLLLVSMGTVLGGRLGLTEYLLAMIAGAAAYGTVSAGLAAGTVAIAKRGSAELGAGEGVGGLEPGLGPEDGALLGVGDEPSRSD